MVPVNMIKEKDMSDIKNIGLFGNSSKGANGGGSKLLQSKNAGDIKSFKFNMGKMINGIIDSGAIDSEEGVRQYIKDQVEGELGLSFSEKIGEEGVEAIAIQIAKRMNDLIGRVRKEGRSSVEDEVVEIHVEELQKGKDGDVSRMMKRLDEVAKAFGRQEEIEELKKKYLEKTDGGKKKITLKDAVEVLSTIKGGFGEEKMREFAKVDWKKFKVGDVVAHSDGTLGIVDEVFEERFIRSDGLVCNGVVVARFDGRLSAEAVDLRGFLLVNKEAEAEAEAEKEEGK